MNKDFSEKKIPEVEVSELSEGYMMLYGVNITLQRAIPMVADGLIPRTRRILYQTYKAFHENFVKVHTAMGETCKIHPHGDMGMNDTFAKMCQTFSNNIPLLINKGNSGTLVAGNDAAASRYWEVRVSKFAKEVLFDEFDGKVNMIQSSDPNTMEPFTLPAKFPIVLLNGFVGIAYTMSSNIYPHNLNEIADATIKLLKNPNADINLVPDSPTGCDIIIKDEETFVMQSSFDIDNVNYMIIIKNTPYSKYLVDIDRELCKIQVSDNPISEIISADDESNLIEGKLRYVIRCKPCNLYQVINKLFKRVNGFRYTISDRNMLVVDPSFRTKKYTVRQILCSWIKNRLIEKRAWLLRESASKTKELNMLNGKLFLLSPENLNKTVKIFRSCDSKNDIVPALMESYKGKITSSQANYASEWKMYQLTAGEYRKTKESIEKLNNEIKDIRETVENPDRIRDTIIDELKTIKNKFGYPRRSKIINLSNTDNTKIEIVQISPEGLVLFGETENPEHLSSDIISLSTENVCLIDEKGQFLWVNTNKVPHDKLITLTSIGKTQMGKCVTALSNIDNDILILTNKGRIKYMPIDRIPSNASRKLLLPISDDEYVVSVLEILDTNSDILIYTTDGMGKRIQISDLNKSLSPDAAGQFILKDHDVGGMFYLNSKKPLLVYVTKLGRMRVNQSKYLLTDKKFANPKSIIKLSPQDILINVFCVDKEQSVILSHADGRITTVNLDSLPVSTMAMEPTRPKHVPTTKIIRATIS